MTAPEKRRVFDLLRQAFPASPSIPLLEAQRVMAQNGVDCQALGYPTFQALFRDMPELLELRPSPENPQVWELALRPGDGAPAEGPLDPPGPEGPRPEASEPPAAPEERPDGAAEGRCELTEADRRAVYRILWEHYPLEFDIPFTDAVPVLNQFGYTPARFFVGEGKAKALHLFQALGDWVSILHTEPGVYFLSLHDAPEALAGTTPFTGKRAGLTDGDRAALCGCLARAFPVNTPVTLMAVGNALASGGVDFRAMGFSRLTRLLPCLMEDLEQVTAAPAPGEPEQVCVQLKPSILRYLPEGEAAPAGPRPAAQPLTAEDRAAILALLREQFGPGAVLHMASIFLCLNQNGYGAKRYGLKGTEMLDQLGLSYRRVSNPAHPDNFDYEITLPGQPQGGQTPPAPGETPHDAGHPAPPAADAPGEAPPAPPAQWRNHVFFHPKTQAILAGFLGASGLTQEQLAQIGQDYDDALAGGRLHWQPERRCYSVPLSLRTWDGKPTMLSIKANDYPGGAPWRVNFVGYLRPGEGAHDAGHPEERRPHGAPEPAPPDGPEHFPAHPRHAHGEASAAEITAPADRLSQRDKLEIYHTLLPLSPVGEPMPLSAASEALANHGLTPQRYGYTRTLQLVSDMPEFFRLTPTQSQPGGPLTYSLTLLPPRQEEAGPGGEAEPADGAPPFAMTERTISFPLSQQGYLSRFLNDPDGLEPLSEEQIAEFQTSYASAVSAGELVYDPAHQCYRFPLSLTARDGGALLATIRRSNRPTPPAWYVSFIEKSNSRGVRPGDKLKQFAQLGDTQAFLANLAQRAEPEKWGFSDDPQDYSILWNYIIYTFYRLDFEGKVYIDDSGAFAAFNTGLLSRRFGEDLLAYFEPNRVPGGPKWRFVCFCSGTNEAVGGAERRAVTLLAPLNLELPRYFSSLYDTMFDPSSKLECNFMHIVRDNLDRFPMDWLHKQCDDHRRTRELLAEIEAEQANCRQLLAQEGRDEAAAASRQRQEKLFEALGAAITDEGDEAMCDLLMDMKDLFESAVGRTLDRCRRNFKLAIPCYFPTRNVMSMLLPISFSRVKNGAPCMALVAERQKNGVYLGRTVLTMSMAYIDARLLCRPSSEWLDTALIREEAGLRGAPEGRD